MKLNVLLDIRSVFVLVVTCLIFTQTEAYFIRYDSEFVDNENQSLLLSHPIEQIEHDSFPGAFNLNFTRFDTNFLHKFMIHDANSNDEGQKVYVIQDGNVYEHSFKINKKHRFYKQQNGESFATLIYDAHTKQYHIIATISDANSEFFYEIKPVVVPSGEDGNEKSCHAIYKRKGAHVSNMYREDGDYENSKFNNALKSDDLRSRKKRAVNGQPVKLYIETLVVADYSVYLDNQRIANTTNQDTVFLNMKIYFAHVINGVNLRFVNSFQNDPDLQISVSIKNFLFCTSLANSTWSDPNSVGILQFPSYNGKDVLDVSSTYTAFETFMNNLNLTFDYDHAIGFLDKDLWSFGTDIATRSAVSSYSYYKGICREHKYSIVEERSGFSSISGVARAIGLNLGSYYDGDTYLDALANCPPSDNYIMNGVFTGSANTILNSFSFSNCSKLQFKQFLLINNGDIASTGDCLKTAPTVVAQSISTANTGYIYSATDQCRMLYGVNSTVCYGTNAGICTSLTCRDPSRNYSCVSTFGIGAAERTPCDVGKSCQQGQCLSDASVSTDSCVFDDDLVTSTDLPSRITLPSQYMTCSGVIDYLKTKNEDFVYYCKDTNFPFKNKCCKTCKVYDAVACYDDMSNCPQLLQNCDLKLPSGLLVGTICKYSCGVCTRTALRCTSPSPCKNGVCINATSFDASSWIGYSCNCSNGYFGQFCDLKDPCTPNPCQSGGICQKLGSSGYSCSCPQNKTGYNCESDLTTQLCNSAICVNGACILLSNGSSTCNCTPGWTGSQCNISISTQSTCNNSTCINGVCNLVNNVSICVCIAGWSGSKCDISSTTKAPVKNYDLIILLSTLIPSGVIIIVAALIGSAICAYRKKHINRGKANRANTSSENILNEPNLSHRETTNFFTKF